MPGTLKDPLAESLSVPNFGIEAETRTGFRHWVGIGAGSIAVHILLFLVAAGLGTLPGPVRRSAPDIQMDLKPGSVTRLVAPPVDVLTQRAPNRGKISQEFNVSSLPPRPAQPNVPQNPGAAAPPRQKFQLPERREPEAPKAALPDSPAPPAVDTAQIRTNSPLPALGTNVPIPPPQIEASEKPKLSFEKPGSITGTAGTSGVGRVPVPKPTSTVEEAARQVARGGGRGLIVGDEDASPGANPSSPSVPIPGKLGSAVELLSDPEGIDFWPYLVKVLSSVRRNWFSVIPESARFGRQGRTVIQFAINRDGTVPKLVIATPSGADALDRAAVAGISASNPFSPLPPEFKGSQIRLQFVFKYNVK
jgi:TonB family protein